jgi:hypothetical protein
MVSWRRLTGVTGLAAGVIAAGARGASDHTEVAHAGGREV